MPVCAIPSHAALASTHRPAIFGDVPLHLTEKERSTLAIILGLLILGLIGMAVLREGPAPARPTAASERPAPPRP